MKAANQGTPALLKYYKKQTHWTQATRDVGLSRYSLALFAQRTKAAMPKPQGNANPLIFVTEEKFVVSGVFKGKSPETLELSQERNDGACRSEIPGDSERTYNREMGSGFDVGLKC